MNKLLALLTVGIALISGAVAVKAQTLDTFSSFGSESGTTTFYGDWTSGSGAPAATFVQGSGVYTVKGVSDSDRSGVAFQPPSDFNLTGDSTLSLTAELAAGNTADSISVILFDGSGLSSSATFILSTFNATTYTTQTSTLFAQNGFNLANVQSFKITGNNPGADGSVAVTFDQLAATQGSAIPEPSTYAAILGTVALGFVMLRRRPVALVPVSR